MSQNLQSLKKRIKTAQNISQIARAMEMIAASKIKKAQAAAQNNKPYSDKITEVLDRMLSSSRAEDIEHPYMAKNVNTQNRLLIAFSPDRGLAGSIVTNLCRKLLEFGSGNLTVVTVGNKIERFASRMGYEIPASFPFGGKFPHYTSVYPLMNIIQRSYLGKQVSEVHLLYTEFRSFFSQSPVAVKVLPIEPPKQAAENQVLPYKFEPGLQYILNELIPYYLEIKLFNALIQAYTSEQAARMIAMGNAKENALDIGESLTLTYNKTRQERITNEILDLANAKIS
ncbi:MAG: ATP synthase F1 subunit gamma [Elusimicrobiota bacterium]